MACECLPISMSAASDGASIATVTLDQPGRPVVVIDQSLLEQLDATLDTLPDNLGGFILASAAPRAYIAGADLKAIMAMNDADLHQYLEFGAKVFQRIADLPCISVAAIHSVALGGGLELAMHCDLLLGVVDPDAKPYIIGLPEAGLKICPGWGGTNLLPSRIDPAQGIEATATGRVFKSDRAAELGLFDATVTSADQLHDAAMQLIANTATPSRNGHPSRCIQTVESTQSIRDAIDTVRANVGGQEHTDAVLDAVGIGLDNGWASALQCERNHLVRLRHTPPAQDAITAFFDKSKAK